jgi:HAD superfamily hydrolase (TIGR01509 family)
LHYDLIIFDCDGVLIDSEIISARMLINELAKLGVDVDLAYISRHFLGRSYPTVMEIIRREFHLVLPDDFEDRYRARLLSAFEQELKVMPHLSSVIDRLAIPYCVATSSSPLRAAKSLQHVGLGHLVGPALFTSTMVAHGKPAPDLFLFAASRMQAEPSRCLVIEDSLTGIRAAKAAGMDVWRFVGGSHMRDHTQDEPQDARPNKWFSSFADFFQIAPDLEART